MNQDLRNFFKPDGLSRSISNNNSKSFIIKKLELNPKKDEQKITLKSKKEPTKKITKEKIINNINKNKNEFFTPKKKVASEIKNKKSKKEVINNNKDKNVINKNIINSNIKPIKRKKNIIIDDDEESNNKQKIVKQSQEFNNNKKNVSKGKKIINLSDDKNSNNENNQIKSKSKDKKLIPISPADFFSGKIVISKKEDPKPLKEEIMEIEDESEKYSEEMNNLKQNEEHLEENSELGKKEVDIINKNKESKIIEIKENDIKKDELNINLQKPGNKPKIIIKRTAKKTHNETEIKQNNYNNKINLSKTTINPNTKNQFTNIQSCNKNQNNFINNLRNKTIKEFNNEKSKINISSNNKIATNKSSELWIDKYCPREINDIIGNKEQIRKLEAWLDNWNDCIFHGNQREVGKKGRGIENLNARATIISGPPGIGKTCSVRVLAKIKGYQIFELNASDKRNKETIENSVGFLMNNKTISNEQKINRKNLILMDEVDGMAGNEDKGGIKALIDIVKKTKLPIIFICNDIYSMKLKSLVNHCYSLKFTKPEKKQIALKLKDICNNENINIDYQSLDNIVESFNSDIRQAINYLDLSTRFNNNFKPGNNSNITYEDVKKDKSVTVNTFEICKMLLMKADTAKLNFNQKLDLFFVDFDLIPLMIYENYYQCAMINNNSQDIKSKLEKISEGLDNMSLGDTIDQKMKSQMDWSLLPNKGIHSTVIPSNLFSSYITYPRFPEIINKSSKLLKINRQLKELRLVFPQYKLTEIQNQASPVLYQIIMNNLICLGKTGIDKIINIFLKYKLTLNLFKENLYELQSKHYQELFNNTNSSVKSLLTKKLNERLKSTIKEHRPKTIMMPAQKRDAEGNIIEDEYEDDDVDEEVADEESSSIFEPIRKKKNKK